MKNEKVPFLKSDEVMVVPLLGELNDRELAQFEENLLQKCARDQKLRGVVIDLSSLESVDLFLGRTLLRLTRQLELMDLNSVLVGLHPEVAITLVEMGISLPGIQTALNLEQGLKVLRRVKKQ